MHGGALWPAAQRGISGWNRLADEHGFIVVYPAGRGRPKRWGTFFADSDLERDVRFVAELIDTLRAAYAIDRTRIYADGLSNGGGMAFVLSCTLADRIAAVGMVAPAQTLPADWCPDTRPIPMMAFHGDADPILPYRGGPMGGPTPVRPVFAPVRHRMAWWAARNQCAGTPVEAMIAADVARITYPDCAAGAPVVFHRLLGGGHTWPGGSGIPRWYAGPTTRSIDATREMWRFFQRHALASP
jgi:polyhydroxybutyrate depolymerase